MQAVIFDFNGVLWWDGHLQDKAWKAYSKTLRGRALTDKEMDVHVHGRNNRYTLEYLTGETITGDRLHTFSEEKETVYRDLCLAQGMDFKLSPGAVEFLDFLDEKNVPHTIATASANPNVDFFIENLNLERWFDPDLIVYDDGIKAGKPAPDFFLHAALLLGKDPGDCVVIEDSISGIASAKAAGIGFVFALGPVSRHLQLQRTSGVGGVISTLADIPHQMFEAPEK